MEPVTYVSCGLLVAVGSGIVGRWIGANGKMSEKHCKEKQTSCQNLMVEKIDNLGSKVDALTTAVNNNFR